MKQRADQETQLEQRTQILADALTQFPDDPTLEIKLNEALELKTQVTQLVNLARAQEETKHYDEALTHWDALQAVYPQYPDLSRNVERLKKLSEEELAAKKAEQARRLAEQVQRVESVIASGDLQQAETVLGQAQREFPSESKFADLDNRIREAVKLRAKAQKLLAPAEKAFEKSQWEKGFTSLKRGCEAAPEDPIVRKQAIDQLTRAFDLALKADWQSANTLLHHAEELGPDPALLQALRTRVEDRKKEQLVAGYLTQAAAARKSGDLDSELRHLESGLAAFPDEPQLVRMPRVNLKIGCASVSASARKKQNDSRNSYFNNSVNSRKKNNAARNLDCALPKLASRQKFAVRNKRRRLISMELKSCRPFIRWKLRQHRRRLLRHSPVPQLHLSPS